MRENLNKYENLPTLSEAVNDAREVASLFQAQGARVVKLFLDEQATSSNISRTLSTLGQKSPTETWLPGEVRPGETVVINLSGHAARSGGKWWFAAYDYTAVTKPGSLDDGRIFSNMVRLLDHGHRVLLIVDCCFAGQIRHSLEWRNEIYDLGEVGDPRAPGGMIVLAASAPSQPSKDGPVHGRFTQSLLEALRGQADLNQDHKVTLREVSDYLSWRVRELEYQRPKLPGLNWEEQDPLAFATPSIPESFVLTRGVTVQPLREGDVIRAQWRTGQGVPRKLIPGNAWRPEGIPRPLGAWQRTEQVTGPGGKVFEITYVLEFREDGTYRAEYRDARGSSEVVFGKYEFEPLQPYGFCLD